MTLKINILLLIFSVVASAVTAQVTLRKFDVRCHGEKNGRIEVDVNTNGSKVKSYLWENEEKVPRRIGLGPGKYCVTVTDESGCTDMACALITQPPPIRIFYSRTLVPAPDCGQRTKLIYSSSVVGGSMPTTVFPDIVTVSGLKGDVVFTATDSKGCKEKRYIAYTNSIRACGVDPNDIQGPSGIGEEQFISISDTSDYRIRVENDAALASSPANLIHVTMAIPPEANLESFRLADFGFANLDFSPPPNVAFYQTTLDVSNELGVKVQVTAGLDVSNMEAFWLLRAVDAITGVPNTNPNLGVLPINDESMIGEGYFDFTLSPDDGLVTGDTLALAADIVFDQNEVIPTNVWTNTIDAVAPTTMVVPLPDTLYTDSIEINWTAADDVNGSGYARSEIWVAENGDQFFLVTEREGGTFTYKNSLDQNVKMLIVSVDSVGNREVPTDTLDLFFVPEPELDLEPFIKIEYCLYDSVLIDATQSLVSDFDLFVKRNSQPDSLLYADVDTSVLPYVFEIENQFVGDTLRFIVVSNDDISLTDTFSIRAYGLPEVVASDDVVTCQQDYPFVFAEGANSYVWSPSENMGDSLEAVTGVYFQNSGYAYVTGTDLHGCSNVDSVLITYLPVYKDTIDVEFCVGDSVLVDGEYIYTPGYYQEDFSTVDGCDSTIVYNIFNWDPCVWENGDRVFVDQDATGANDGTSWTDAYNELYDGLYTANRYVDVDSVWIAEGTYMPISENRQNSFIFQKETKLFGGFMGTEGQVSQRSADSTLVVLSGDIGVVGDSLDNSYHVVSVKEDCVDCELSTLTVSYGLANGPLSVDQNGAGLHIAGVASLQRLLISANTASSSGAGMYVIGSLADVLVKDCTLIQNEAVLQADIMVIDGAHVLIDGVVNVKN